MRSRALAEDILRRLCSGEPSHALASFRYITRKKAPVVVARRPSAVVAARAAQARAKIAHK